MSASDEYEDLADELRRRRQPQKPPVRKQATPGHTTLTQERATAPPNLPEPPR
jgi:hypothetical protein